MVANFGYLIAAAPILPVIPILGLLWLKPKEELAGWAVFTVWLGSTYLATGLTQEVVAFMFITACAILGYFKSPWFLVAAWFGHILWDFMPRELPEILLDLPTACLIFDGLIGLFIIYAIKKNRWQFAQ